ncbi:hypothetical protein SA20092_04130 [Staphylococcus argenteus]|nr:hypothetical protein SA20092_04130 [Staphylococcus argenteus]
MKNIVKVFNTTILALIIIIATFGNTANAAESGTLDYEVYKYNTNDTSIANDYFNKPAKYFKKMVNYTFKLLLIIVIGLLE